MSVIRNLENFLVLSGINANFEVMLYALSTLSSEILAGKNSDEFVMIVDPNCKRRNYEKK